MKQEVHYRHNLDYVTEGL